MKNYKQVYLSCEYYYNTKQQIVFAYAYKKVNGKTKEYRAYYGSDGKLYRYIGPDGKVKDFKKGVDSSKIKMAQKLQSGGMYIFHF